MFSLGVVSTIKTKCFGDHVLVRDTALRQDEGKSPRGPPISLSVTEGEGFAAMAIRKGHMWDKSPTAQKVPYAINPRKTSPNVS